MNNQFETSLSEHDALAYHTALVELESILLDVSQKDDLSAVLSMYQETIVVNNPALEKHIHKNISKFKDGIEKYKNEYSNLDFAKWMIEGIRRERKKYDKYYFSSLLKRENPNVEQAQSFMETIYHDDPAYYNTAYAVLLESFKDLSRGIFKDKNITDAQKKISQVEHARKIVNKLNKNFQVELFKGKEKPYEYRVMDRILFNGMISYELYKERPMSLEKAKEIAPLQAHKCLNNIETRYCARKSDVSKNARVLVDIFRDVMKRYHMNRQPFPILVNKVCEELKIRVKGGCEFRTVRRDANGKKKKDEKGQQIWAEPLKAYCLQHGILYPHDGMDNGLNYIHRKSIENIADNKQAFCEVMEAYLVDFCVKNSRYLDSRIITAALEKYKYFPGAEQELFYFLTSAPVVSEDGENLGPLFSKELHHDRERIGFSNNPNDKMENYIMTFAPNVKIGEKGIYNYCVELLKKRGVLSAKAADEFLQRAAMLDVPSFNVHNQILHGADAHMYYKSGQDDWMVMYFVSPVRPKERDPKSKDSYVLAMVDTSGIVYDKTKYRYQLMSCTQTQKVVAQLRKLGRAS